MLKHLQMNILADHSLPDLDGLFQAPFHLSTYQNESMLRDALPHQDILLCRSTLRVTPELLHHSTVRYVATASSGVDHIDAQYLKTKNIQLFDAKGSNAEAVENYVLATLAYLQTHDQVPGLRAGVIGCGAVGTRVALQLKRLGFKVVIYDPPKAQTTPDFTSSSLDALFNCDVLCIHANLHNTAPHATRNLLDHAFLSQLKAGTVIINAARGGILDEQALLKLKQPLTYCTDVYQNEPEINPSVIAYATLCTPHVAGHSIEAKYKAVFDLSQALHQQAGLSPPRAIERPKPKHTNPSSIWYEHALQLYNPIHETLELKQARNQHACFLSLRRAHQHRHDFSLYSD